MKNPTSKAGTTATTSNLCGRPGDEFARVKGLPPLRTTNAVDQGQAPVRTRDSGTRGSVVYLCSKCHEPSQSAGGGLCFKQLMRFANVVDGWSPGTASSAAVNAIRASSQRR